MLDRADAETIASKLKASFKEGANHKIAQIYVDGKLVAWFGICRGKKGQGHDHIPSQIYVTNKQAKLLAQCPMKYEEWLLVMQEKGHIVVKPAPPKSATVSQQPSK